METVDTDFDSDLHEALTTVPSDDESKKGKVVDEMEKGYYPYPSLDECISDQHHSNLNLFWDEIKGSIAFPSSFRETELLDWLQALLLLPGRVAIYLLVAVAPSVHSQLSNGVESLYGWPPVAAAMVIYGVPIAAFAGWTLLPCFRSRYGAG